MQQSRHDLDFLHRDGDADSDDGFQFAQLLKRAVIVAGAIADRYGPGKVLVAGLIVLSLGTALTPFMTSGFGLIVALGVSPR